MKMSDLKQILKEHEVWPYDYAVGDPNIPLSDCAICIQEKKGHFEIYVLERGKKHDSKTFTDENQACL